MTTIPAHELDILLPHIREGLAVLEFGNKKNPSGLYRDWYESRGCRYTCVDINGRDGAVKHDVRQQLDIGTFDVVTNWGFSEHVSVQRPFWANVHAATAADGVAIGTTPQPNHWPNHGWSYWHPMREFFIAWAHANDYTVERLEPCGPGPADKLMWGYVLRKRAAQPHEWAFDGMFWRNPNWSFPPGDHVEYGAV